MENEMRLTEKEKRAGEMLCLPLDGISTREGWLTRVKELSPIVGLFKAGMEGYTRFGPWGVKAIQDLGAKVFVDLKYYDIPNTVREASKAIAELGVYMFNVHASGGIEMMRAAVEGAREGAEKYGKPIPKIVGVTVLTSFDEARYLQTHQPLNPSLEGIDFEKYIKGEDDETLQTEFRSLIEAKGLTGIIQKQVLHLARNAKEAGLDGIVCSAADLYAVKDKLPDDFMYVNPGIKGVDSTVGSDQKRVFTPYNAVKAGSSILVVGRAITSKKTAEERVRAGYEILKDMARAKIENL